MATTNGNNCYRVGTFLVDLRQRRVSSNGTTLELSWRHFEALRLLIEADGQVVEKQAFFSRLWPDLVVDESNLTKCISQLRKALTEIDPAMEYLETAPRIGYRLAAPVTEAEAKPLETAGRKPWLAVAALGVVIAGGIWVGRHWWQERQQSQHAEKLLDQASELLRRPDRAAAAEAVAVLQKAIEIRPKFGPAYAVLAQALNKQGQLPGILRPMTSLEAAERSVSLDPNCGDCQGALGFFLFYHGWQWQRAEPHLRRAIELKPDDSVVRAYYAMLLGATGRLDKALEQADEGVRLSPFSARRHTIRGEILYLQRRFAEAVAAADQALSRDAQHKAAWEVRSKALFLMDRPEEGLKAMAECAFAYHSGELGRAWRESGREGGLKKLLAITDGWRETTVQAWRRAVWKALLDDTQGALDEIGKARELRNVNLLYVAVDPVYDSLRGDPRFIGMLEGMGLTASQVSSR